MLATAERDPLTEVGVETSPLPPARRMWILAVGVVAAVVLVPLAVWFGVSSTNSAAGQAPTAVETTQQAGEADAPAPTSAPDDPALNQLMAQISEGWIPYQGFVIGSGAEGPLGVAPAGYEHEAPDFRTPIYDVPDGNVIGYSYAGLGYLPLDKADAGIFDATAARIEMYGCDPSFDVECPAVPLAGGYLEGLAQLDPGS